MGFLFEKTRIKSLSVCARINLSSIIIDDFNKQLVVIDFDHRSFSRFIGTRIQKIIELMFFFL